MCENHYYSIFIDEKTGFWTLQCISCKGHWDDHDHGE